MSNTNGNDKHSPSPPPPQQKSEESPQCGTTSGGNDKRTPSPAPPSPPPPPPPQQKPEESPRRGTTSGGSSPHSPSPQRPRRPPPFSPLPGYVAPVMGVRGQSAFSSYTGPRRPTVQQPGPFITGPQLPMGLIPGPYAYYGIPGAMVPLPVIHGAPGSSGVGGALRIGGMENPEARKRVREGDADAAHLQGGGNVGGENRSTCSVCGKEFGSSRALFGHMRSHPGRGWKGAHPPPKFSAADEFADLASGLVPRNEDGAEEVPIRVEEAGGDAAEAGDGGGETEGGEGRAYRVPDLNSSPPEE